MSFFNDIGKSISKGVSSLSSGTAAGDLLNGATNFVTGGMVGYGKGGFQEGYASHPADEALGQVTGRNQSRAALNQSQAQFNLAQQQAQALIAQQQWNAKQADITASNSAGAASRTAALLSGANFSNATPMALGPGFNGGQQKDFLGL